MDFASLTKDTVEERLNQSVISARKVKKWAATGLLEGLKTKEAARMARLLENQAKALLEASDTR